MNEATIDIGRVNAAIASIIDRRINRPENRALQHAQRCVNNSDVLELTCLTEDIEKLRTAKWYIFHIETMMCELEESGMGVMTLAEARYLLEQAEATHNDLVRDLLNDDFKGQHADIHRTTAVNLRADFAALLDKD